MNRQNPGVEAQLVGLDARRRRALQIEIESERRARRVERKVEIALVVILLAVIAALCACGERLPIQVRDGHSLGSDLDELPAEVEDACAILGLECEATQGEDWGVIYLDLVDVADTERVHGRTLAHPRCAPRSWVVPDARLIAHELGHALGLHHSSDVDGVMHASRPGFELSDSEMGEIERGGNRLVGCRL